MPRVLGDGNPKHPNPKPRSSRPVPRVRGKRRAGQIHASKFEDTIIQDLKDRGIEHEYEPETFKYVRVVRGATCSLCGGNQAYVQRRYTPDLKIGAFYVEIKGKLDSETRSRMEAFLAGHSEKIDLRFLFMRDNWLTGKHKTKYSDWAKKLGMKYAIGASVPQEWVVPSSGV